MPALTSVRRLSSISAFRQALLPLLAAGLLAMFTPSPGLGADREPPLQFNRDIRPILSDVCFQCHGPDSVQRKADLRLDTKDGLLGSGGSRVVVPGQPAASELIRRITSDDPELRMPPPTAGKQLSAKQIALLKRWVQEGAAWQPHWSYLPVTRPDVPQVSHGDWPRNAIDRFILARLEREGLQPAEPASRETLIRRVTLDLTGLPPTPDQVDAFLADTAPGAWNRVVDRLLDSPAWGERMATEWLDAARYADTNGYQTDAERYMWRWRDWVIDAFNSNQPFDQFTIEQLAGDLLPEPTLAQRIATGFNRNHRGNGEGGIIPEEYAVEYVVDRVETTATVWMGLTLGCARCHDHKFDPFTQKDFYQLYAFFNSIPENGRANKYGNSPPMIHAPLPAQQRQLDAIDERANSLRQQLAALKPQLRQARAEWETATRAQSDEASTSTPASHSAWTITDDLISRFCFEDDLRDEVTTETPRVAKSDSRDPVFADSAPSPGSSTERSLSLDGQQVIEAGDVGQFGFYDRFTLAAWILPDDPDAGIIVSRMEAADLDRSKGYQLRLRDGYLEADFVVRWLDDSLRVRSRERLPAGGWRHVAVTYDGSRVAAGVQLYVDGQPVPLVAHIDELNQSFDSTQPLRIGGGPAPQGRFRGRIDDVRVYSSQLSPADMRVVACRGTIPALVQIPSAKRTPLQQARLQRYFVSVAAPEKIRRLHQQLQSLARKRLSLVDSLPTVMVMEELPAPRPAWVLRRGEYNQPGEQVSRAVPSALPPLPDDVPKNRLGLARWLVSREHPLTSRVTVNRLWSICFGAGLVRTPEDFGSQGEQPTHPQLLDWLAAEFMQPEDQAATAWDVKRMLRLMVTSATYQQASHVTDALRERDPENHLLARGPRYRLPAEMIRDQALAASGLLVQKTGGPSVRPYQPAGLWEEVSGQKYEQQSGDALYRRSMYTFFKRTVAPPLLSGFDAAGRETCTVERSRTNTPLQALALLNSTTFVESSRVLAARAMKEGGPEATKRLTRLFRLVTARVPAADELQVLHAGLQRHLQHFRAHPEAAKKLLAIGEAPVAADIDAIELAAYTTLASLVLNLDETLTRE